MSHAHDQPKENGPRRGDQYGPGHPSSTAVAGIRAYLQAAYPNDAPESLQPLPMQSEDPPKAKEVEGQHGTAKAGRVQPLSTPQQEGNCSLFFCIGSTSPSK